MGRVGWLPVIEVAAPADNQIYFRLKGWAGLAGTPPSDFVGYYLSTNGWVADIAQAVNFHTLLAGRDGTHGLTPEEIDEKIAEFYRSNIFGDNKGRGYIATFHPDDFSTLRAFGRWNEDTLERPDAARGFYVAMRDNDGAGPDPVRILAWSDGNQPRFFVGFKMGANLVWTEQTAVIADGSITKDKLAQALQDEIDAAAATSIPDGSIGEEKLDTPLTTKIEQIETNKAAAAAADLKAAGAKTAADQANTNAGLADDKATEAKTAADNAAAAASTADGKAVAAQNTADSAATAAATADTQAVAAKATADSAQTTATAADNNSIIGGSVSGETLTLNKKGGGSGITINGLPTSTGGGADSTARASAAEGINRARANMASIVSIRNAVADADITTKAASGSVVGTGRQAILLTANQINQNQYVLLIDGDDNAALVATREMRAGNINNIPIGDKMAEWHISSRIFQGVSASPPPNGFKRAELFTLTTPADVKAFAEADGRDIEFADLAEALQSRITAANGAQLPANLARLSQIFTDTQHPEGIWERPTTARGRVNQPFAALFTNASTTPNSISPEPFTKGGVAIASGTRTNFVRRHADPNSEDNAWPGVSPYTTGQLDITKAANEKNLIFSCIIGQSTGNRAAVGAGDASEIMFQLGNKQIMRFNQRGLELSVGVTAGGTAQTRLHFVRYDSHTLPHISNTLYNNNIATAVAGHQVDGVPRIKLTAKQYIADEQAPRTTPSITIRPAANTGITNFAIPIAGQQSIVGTLQFNASNRGVTYRFTSGHNVPGETFTIDFAVEISETITLPNGTVWGGMLAAESLSHPEFFQQAHINELIFAFVKVHDEADSANNLMKIVYRINGFTHEQLLHQTRAQLQLDSANVKLATTLQNVARVQLGTYDSDHPPSAADLTAFDVNVIGWNQIVRNHADDEVKLSAKLSAHEFGVLNPNDTVTPFKPPASWAQEGSSEKIPPPKLNLSAQNPSGILLPHIQDVARFSAQTDDIDTGWKLDDSSTLNGTTYASGVRSQFERLLVPVEYKKGVNLAAIAPASHPFNYKVMEVPLDMLPTGNDWQRFFHIDEYKDTLQRIDLRVFRAGGGNVHVNLIYRNNNDGHNYLAHQPAGVTRFSDLRVARIHDVANQSIYLMPRSAKGEKGDDGAKGEKGDTGASGGLTETERALLLPSSATEGQIAVKRGSVWVAEAAPSGGGISDAERARLLPTPAANGQIAEYVNGAWAAVAKPSGGGTATQSIRVVLAATASSSPFATLPTDYENFNSLEVVVLDSNGQVTTRDILVSWLAATASNSRIRVSGAGFITWTRSARVLQLTAGDVFQAVTLVGAAAVQSITDSTARAAAASAQSTANTAKSTADAAATKNTQQDATIAAIRQVPAGGNDGQFVGRVGGAAAWVAAPSGGGTTDQTARDAAAAAQGTANDAYLNSVSQVGLSGNRLVLQRPNGTNISVSGLENIPDQTARNLAAAAQSTADSATTAAAAAQSTADSATTAAAAAQSTADSATTAAAAAQSTADAATTPEEAKALIKPFARTGDSTKIAAADIADGLTIPAGGTTKQALVKTSASDRAVEWATIAGFNISENLLSSPITQSASVNPGEAVRTIDLTGAEKVIVGVDVISNSTGQFFYEFPASQLSAVAQAHSGINGQNRSFAFSFPQNALTASASIRADVLTTNILQIFGVWKITA